MLPGEKMQRGSRYGMEGRDLVFQNDGNLCVYAGAGDRWIWCVSNDPQVQSAQAPSVDMMRDGRLVMLDADSGRIWAAPANRAQVGSGAHLSADGALELRAPSGAVLWTRRGS